MLITDIFFESYLKCPTKCWLHAQGDIGLGNGYSEWIRSRNEHYQKEGIRRLQADLPQNMVAVNPSQRVCQHGSWKIALAVLAHTSNLESCIDALEHISTKKKNESLLIVPIRFIPLNKITSDHKLKLAYDAFVLAEMLGHKITVGRVVHGDGYGILTVNVVPMLREIQKVTTKIAALLSLPTPPELVLNAHCAECEFQHRCYQEAIEKDELSLLAGLTENKRRKLNNKGIFAIIPLSYTFRVRRRSKRLNKIPEKYHDSLKALAIRERKIHVVGTPQFKIDGTPIYLDVESIPDRDFYYLIGVYFSTSVGHFKYSLWANTEEEESKIWAEFINILASVDNPILIHYGSFETIFMRRMCQRYGEPLEDSKIANTIKSSINLLKIIYAKIYFPTYSNGLKEIAEFLGITWSDPLLFGLGSIVFRCDWEKSQDLSLKQKLLLYNIEDCEALELVTKAVDKLCQGALLETSPDDRVVYTNQMVPPNRYHLINQGGAALPEFVEINKAAYWNYQRHRVYVRSSRIIKKACAKESEKREITLPVRSIVRHPDPTICLHCSSSVLIKKMQSNVSVFDIRFTQSGAKGWIIRHIRNNFYCAECGSLVRAKGDEASIRKYGKNLCAYAVNMLIQLKISQSKVAKLLQELFGFNLSATHISVFKSELATFYKDSVEELIERIVAGPLIHSDETKVDANRALTDSLVAEKDKSFGMLRNHGYVWVLSSMEEVIYLFSETREGEMIQGLLKNFHGVLVSDFYSVYDSICSPQQKCLIHLMRDINDDLHRQPYDNELRKVAQVFANVLKLIVETVDRHGLKTYFLAKYIPSVEKLFDWLSESDFASVTAEGYRKRFLKNRSKLFTFLNHDNVPWNNNNAENAVHAFAELRTIIHGAWSEKGLREYLILLSLCETCKRRGLDFLDFLLAEERSIELFAKTKRSYARHVMRKRKFRSSDFVGVCPDSDFSESASESSDEKHNHINFNKQHNVGELSYDSQIFLMQEFYLCIEMHAKQCARFWLVRLARKGYNKEHDPLMSFMRLMSENPNSVLEKMGGEVKGEDRWQDEYTEWVFNLVSLLEILPDPKCHYNLLVANGATGELIPDCLMISMEEQWQNKFPCISFLGEIDPWENIEWYQWLLEHPFAFNNFNIIYDVVAAIYETPKVDALDDFNSEIVKQLLSHFASLFEIVIAENNAQGCLFEWRYPSHRPALHLLVHHVENVTDNDEILRLLKWIVGTLNPNDELCCRESLALGLLENCRAAEALELCYKFPNDWLGGMVYAQVLAQHQLGNLDKAAIMLTMAGKRRPKIFQALIDAKPQRPSVDFNNQQFDERDEEAWYYRIRWLHIWKKLGALYWLTSTAITEANLPVSPHMTKPDKQQREH